MPPNPVYPVVLDTQHAKNTAHWDAHKNGNDADVAHVEAQSSATVRRKRATRDGRDAAGALNDQQKYGPSFYPRDEDARAANSTGTVSRPVLNPVQPRCTEVRQRRKKDLSLLPSAPQRRAMRQIFIICDCEHAIVSKMKARRQSLQVTLLLEATDPDRDTMSTQPGTIVVSRHFTSGHTGRRTRSIGSGRHCRREYRPMRTHKTCGRSIGAG